jgi:hypothetical protein
MEKHMKHNYFPLAHNFFNLTENVMNEMIIQGNRTQVISDVVQGMTDEKEENIFKHRIRWSDIKIGIPLMFNFYHGIELFLKGLLQEKDIEVKSSHNLESLYQLVKSNDEKFTREIIDLMKKHIHNAYHYNPFFNDNNLSAKDFYIAFKYPVSNTGQRFNYQKIRGQEKISLEVYKNILQGIIDLKQALINWKMGDQKDSGI